MTFYNIVTTLVEDVLKGTPLPTTYYPVKVKLTDEFDVEITNTYFGVTEVIVPDTSWTVTHNTPTNTTTVNNTANITFGTSLGNFTNVIKLKLYTADNILLGENELDTNLETGTELILYDSTGISLSLNFGGRGIQEFILKLIFKNITTRPTNLYMSLRDSANQERLRYVLTPSRWSYSYLNNLGAVAFEYGETKNIPVSTSILTEYAIYDAPTAGIIWFYSNIGLPSTEGIASTIYSNSVKLVVANPGITNYVPSDNATSLLHLAFNGTLFDAAQNTLPTTFVSAAFNATDKLFGTECLSAGSLTNLTYSNVAIPNTFTFQTFVQFSTATAGRAIVLFDKINIFRIEKTLTNNLVVSINGSPVITEAWTPVTSAWQHIWVQKKAGTLQLRVNAGDINTTVTYATTVIDTTQPIIVSTPLAPINGFSNGVYLSSDSTLAFSNGAAITAPNPYDVNNLDFNLWANSTVDQIKNYF